MREERGGISPVLGKIRGRYKSLQRTDFACRQTCAADALQVRGWQVVDDVDVQLEPAISGVSLSGTRSRTTL